MLVQMTYLIVLATSIAARATPPPPGLDAPPPSVEFSTAEAWLEKIEDRLKTVKTIHADIVFHQIDGVGILDDKQTRHGHLAFQTGKPARFSVHFVKLFIGGRPEKRDMWYIFDGRWFVQRNDTEKIFTKQQVVPPDAAPEQSDPLASGEGPFLLPITTSKSRILKRFHVEVITPAKKDPPDTVHLRMKPKPGRRTEITRLDIWYHKKTMLPVRVETIDEVPNQKIVIIKRADLNKPVDPKSLDVSVPSGPGWRKQVTGAKAVISNQ